MPKDARLLVFYDDLRRYDELSPLDAELQVHFLKDGTIVSEPILPHFPNPLLTSPQFIFNACFTTFETHFIYIYSNIGQPDSVFQQSFGEVSQGDTIQFFYDTDFGFGRDTLAISSSNEITLSNGLIAGWDVTLGSFDFCLNRFLDKLDIFIGVITDSFTVTISEPDSIWPTLPATQGGNPEARNVKDTTTVVFYQNDIPIPNQDVTIKARIIPGSGGHNHTDDQPLEDSLGVFITYGANPDTSQGMITAKTDANGLIHFSYRSPRFAGEIELTATTVAELDTLVARDTLLVEVPDLELLGNGINYIKIGGTCNHHGPRNDNLFPNCRTPDNNHYGIENLRDDVVAIADSFAVEFPNHLIQINDMSLPNGGGFDISGDWDADFDLTVAGNTRICEQAGNGHCGHRLGENADIGFRIIDPQGQDILTTPEQRRGLLEIITRISGDPFEHNDHYHIQ